MPASTLLLVTTVPSHPTRLRWPGLVLLAALCACTPGVEPGPALRAEEAGPAAHAAKERLGHAYPAAQMAELEAPARVLAAPEAAAVVSAPLAAHVERVRVRAGQTVKQGEALVDVVMPELIKASAALSAAALRLSGYELQRQRLAPLVRDGLVLASDLLALDAQIANAKAEQESARAVLQSAGMAPDAAQQHFARTASVSLRAPIAGVITRVDVRPGEMREPLSGPLLELAGAGAVSIEARFALLPDKSAEFEWLGQGGALALDLQSISPVAAEGGARLVWLTPRVPSALSAGSVGRVRVRVPDAWVAIPRAALRTSGSDSYVEVPAGERRERRSVKQVQVLEREAIVVGISPGTAVFQAAAAQLP